MAISAEERQFLIRRKRLLRAWPVVLAVLLGLVVGLGLWLYCTNPLLLNPYAVLARLEADALPHATLALMAASLPILALACLALVSALLALAQAAFSNERRYLAILERTGVPEGGAMAAVTAPDQDQ